MENVTFRLRQQRKLSKAAARDIAVATVTDLGLAPHVIDQYPAELSGGMQACGLAGRLPTNLKFYCLMNQPLALIQSLVASLTG